MSLQFVPVTKNSIMGEKISTGKKWFCALRDRFGCRGNMPEDTGTKA